MGSRYGTDPGARFTRKIKPIWRNSSEKIVESARNCEQRPQLDINGLYDTSRGGEAMPNVVNHQGNGTHPWFDSIFSGETHPSTRPSTSLTGKQIGCFYLGNWTKSTCDPTLNGSSVVLSILRTGTRP